MFVLVIDIDTYMDLDLLDWTKDIAVDGQMHPEYCGSIYIIADVTAVRKLIPNRRQMWVTPTMVLCEEGLYLIDVC